MKDSNHQHVYSREEREVMLRQMQAISDNFYAMAIRVGCHPFIEFCGLMNEYIKVCREAQQADIDFTNATAHSGHVLPMQVHHAEYLGEKLGCIYGPTLASSPELRRAFFSAMGLESWIEHRQLPANECHCSIRAWNPLQPFSHRDDCPLAKT